MQRFPDHCVAGRQVSAAPRWVFLEMPQVFSLPYLSSSASGHLDSYRGPALPSRLLLTLLSTVRPRRPMEAQKPSFSLAGLLPGRHCLLNICRI